MLPGTYIPTDPRELETFALHEAEQEISLLGPAIHNAENAYRRVGLKYYELPINSRQNHNDEEIKSTCREAFIVSEDHTPSIILRIVHLRELTDTIKAQIRSGQGLNAKANLELAAQDLSNLHETLKELVSSVQSYLWPDNISPANHVSEDEDDAAERAWILALPENKKAVELGFYSKNELFDNRFVHEDGPTATTRRIEQRHVRFEEPLELEGRHFDVFDFDEADDLEQARYEDAGYVMPPDRPVRFDNAGFVAPPASMDED